MSSVLEHTRVKSAVEDETLGVQKQRAGRLLHQRVVSRTLPGKMTSRVKQRRQPTRSTIMKLGCFTFSIFTCAVSCWEYVFVFTAVYLC